MITSIRHLPDKVLYLVLICVMLSLSSLLLYAHQSDFYLLTSLYGIAFLGYYLIIAQEKLKISTIKWIIVAAIAIRFFALFIFPHLSNDIYRFVWDGKLILNGYSPYTMLPSDVITKQINGLEVELYAKLNSQNYYSVYPPVTQLIFLVGAWVESIYWSSVIYKSLLFISELASITLLYRIIKRQNVKLQNLLIYALNPLIIVEIMGNIHFEGFMMFTFIASWWYIIQKEDKLTGLAIAIGSGIKLIPLLFTPIYWAFRDKSKWLFITTAILTATLFTPVYLTLPNFSKSVDLYFGKFEFNASIYYVLRAIGNYLTGYNLIRYIGALPILVLLTIGSKYLFSREKLKPTISNIANGILLCYSFYLFTTTTVHPWYLSTLILCSVFSSFRYAIVWSGLVVLSYSHYKNGGFLENYLLISIEYAIVYSFLAYEYYIQKKRFISL